MKKSLLSTLFLMALCIGSAGAQTLINPTGWQSTYPALPSPLTGPGHTSAYHIANTGLNGSPVDFYVAGANGANNGITWQATALGAPATIIMQGTIPLPMDVDIEVGSVFLNGSPAIIVTYYQMGVGHFIDVYEYFAGATNFTLTSSTPLSSSASYTRISADFHKGYGIAAAWEDNGAINTIYGMTSGGAITWSSILTLAGTGGGHDVDLAFAHIMSGTGGNWMHYVYQDGSNHFVECKANWATIIGGSSPYPATVEDVYSYIPGTVSIANIDCPDHYDVDNWAYTFRETPNPEPYMQGILVRLFDHHTSATPTTAIVTNGSLGNIPMSSPSPWFWDLPTLSYEQNGQSMYVGWYAESMPPLPNFNTGHVCVQIDESGTTLLSAPDYLMVSNTASQNLPLALSKMNDYLIPSNFVYGCFYDNTGVNVLTHAWHPRSPASASFRPANGNIVCGPDLPNISKAADNGIRLYPNPFTTTISWNGSGKWRDGRFSVDVYSVAGSIVHISEGVLSDVSGSLDKVAASIPPGAYFVKVTNANMQRVQTFPMTKK